MNPLSPRNFRFTLEHRSAGTNARAGVIETKRNRILTPVFMPVATHALVRSQPTETLSSLDYGIILANTYHLLLRPGPEIFKQFGDIHRFMQWDRSVLTDSGGYQVFSLASQLQIGDEGATFRSYVDGKKIELSPEASIETQKAIGSDIMMVLDQCVPSMSEWEITRDAAERTFRWAKRSLEARGDSPQALFGIVQGGRFMDIRESSAEQITSLPFDGYAIGGVAVGESREIRDDIVARTAELLPAETPRYLMGVGTPIDLLESVASGLDMFDCIMPSAFAQQGVLFTSRGRIDIRRGVYRTIELPLDENCKCTTCSTYSTAYLHHLMKVGEFVGGTLLGVHNLYFYKQLMEEMRRAIISDEFDQYYRQKRMELVRRDETWPSFPPVRKARV